MAGFYLEYNLDRLRSGVPLELVDLGECDVVGSFETGPVRAVWNYWSGSKQWWLVSERGRRLLIEGHPDRYPRPGEPLAQWMEGRSGGFRGFEVAFGGEDGESRPEVTVFVDALATRPVFLSARNGCVAVADKLADLVVNWSGPLEADWGGLLETAAVGSLYSSDATSLEGVELLKPGAVVGIEDGRIAWRKRIQPTDGGLDPERVRREPAAALREAFTRAVNETWSEPSAALLLSGGLDSRSTLAFARGRRKTVTIDFVPAETKLAAQVAACCDCDHREIRVGDQYFENALAVGYLVTGAMHGARLVSHLGLFDELRAAGITGLCHGWPYNTVFRSWVARPYEKRPVRRSPLFEWMGSKAVYFQNYGCIDPSAVRYLAELLTPEGREVLRKQLGKLAESLEIVIERQMDLTFERRLLSEVLRQVYAGFATATMEGSDVYSPAFHPAVWSWYQISSPESRYSEWVYREMLIQSKHPAFEIPDSNTGAKVEHLRRRWQDRYRNHFWYPPFRAVYLALFRKEAPAVNVWPTKSLAGESLEGALAGLDGHPLFHKEAIEALLRRCRGGETAWLDTLWSLGIMGQWRQFTKARRAPEALMRCAPARGGSDARKADTVER